VADYLLDTSTISLMVRRDPAVTSKAASLARDNQLLMPTIVRGEILYGLDRLPEGDKKRQLSREIFGLFATFPCISIPPAAGDHYARIKTIAENSGSDLSENDLWIAATSLSLNSILVSADKDFRRIPDLNVEDWSV
jgi:predicted nucleic acid-binding protein